MNKYELVKRIENFAPPNTAEKWDLSGWITENSTVDVNKIMLCLTITDDIVKQAQREKCDMIISHHPLFFVPLEFNCGINMYCAHTNLDKAPNGTTETLIKALGFNTDEIQPHEYLRFCTLKTEISFENLISRLKKVSENIRYVNKKGLKFFKKTAFCAGSGTEFWQFALDNGADILITGDLKYHAAVDTEIPIIDIGHFESEVPVLNTLTEILKGVEVVIAHDAPIIKQI